jgi:hypothetical protein
MPGYGFSGKLTTTGRSPARIARASITLKQRLGAAAANDAFRRIVGYHREAPFCDSCCRDRSEPRFSALKPKGQFADPLG